MQTDEWLDIYDANLVKQGIKRRSDVHREGDWHRTFHAWVISPEAGGSMLLQRRGLAKEEFPGVFDVSAAGHYQAGESGRDGVRELQEELGIQIDPSRLQYLGIRTNARRYNGVVDYEFNEVFALIDPRPLDEYDPLEDEVHGLALVPLAAGVALLTGRTEKMEVPYLMAQGHRETLLSLSMDDLMPSKDAYFLKMFIMAERLLKGQPAVV